MIRCSALIVLMWLSAAACGGNGAVPDVEDASRSDSNPCDCPTADTLTADRIWRQPYAGALGNYTHLILGVHCEDSDQLIGGGCMLTPLAPMSTLSRAGYRQGADSWACGWYNRSSTTNTAESMGVCLLPSSKQGNAPASCECPPVEPVGDRILKVERGGFLAGNSVYSLTSTCELGHLLIGGGCIFDSVGLEGREPTLISSGFNAEGTEWACTWKNPTAESFPATATATCIRPPTPGTAPEAEPLTDRIDIITQTTTLPVSDAHITDVSCAPGDFLLWGSCALDSPADHPDVTMFRSGFLSPDQNRPNTWQCAWNNPTTLTSAATAIAVCLTPLGV